MILATHKAMAKAKDRDNSERSGKKKKGKFFIYNYTRNISNSRDRPSGNTTQVDTSWGMYELVGLELNG